MAVNVRDYIAEIMIYLSMGNLLKVAVTKQSK